MPAQLIAELGPTSSPVFLLPEGETVTLGRNPNNALVLLDRHISRWHAQIVGRKGRYFLFDCHSVNGTRLGGRLVGCETPLFHNQLIRAGGVILRFQHWAEEGDALAPIQIDPNWLLANDRAAFNLASAIAAERQYELLPILADALEDSGCRDVDILGHCRDSREHRQPCWLVEWLVGSRTDSATDRLEEPENISTAILAHGQSKTEVPEE